MTTQTAIVYAQDVVADRIDACELVHRACERFLRDLDQAQLVTSPWEYRADLADRVMRFTQLLPNIKGPEAGKPIKLMPWQCFVLANLFGFVERGTSTRRFRQGVIFVPRGNGKTTFAAPLALYTCFAESEGGAEGYAAATTRDQARLLWDTAKMMV